MICNFRQKIVSWACYAATFSEIGKSPFKKTFFFGWIFIHEARQLVWTTGGLASQGTGILCDMCIFVRGKINGSTVDRSDPAKIQLSSMSTERQQLKSPWFKIQSFGLVWTWLASRQRFHPWFVCSLCIEYIAEVRGHLLWKMWRCLFFSGAIDPCCCQRFGVRVNLFGLVKAECMDIPNHCVRSGPSRAVLESQGISTWCFIALHCACCDHQNYMHHVKHGVTSRSDLKNAWHAMTCHDSHDVKSPQADNTFCSHQLASSKSTRSGEPDFSRWFCLELLHTFTIFLLLQKKEGGVACHSSTYLVFVL